MPYVVAILATLLVLPALGLGVVAAVLGALAAAATLACAVALGATGTLLEWILAALAVGVSWRAFGWRRAVRRLRDALATAGPGIGRLRGG